MEEVVTDNEAVVAKESDQIGGGEDVAPSATPGQKLSVTEPEVQTTDATKRSSKGSTATPAVNGPAVKKTNTVEFENAKTTKKKKSTKPPIPKRAKGKVNPVKQDKDSGIDEVPSDELIKTFQVQNTQEKVGTRLVKRATGFDLLDQYRIGPDVIDEGIECTPLPHWFGKEELPSYATITKKESEDIIPMTPKKSEESAVFDIRVYMQSKSPPMSWTASLTTLEEDEFTAQAQNVQCQKLIYNLNTEAEEESVYIIKDAKIHQPDGSIIIRPRIRVVLTETATMFTLELDGKTELETSETADAIKANNERYLKMVQHHLESDAYSNRFAQTFENRKRDNWTEYKSPAACDTGSQVNSYMIDDEYKLVAEADRKRRLKEEDEERLRLLRQKLSMDRDGLDDPDFSDEDSEEDDKVSLGGAIDWNKYGGKYEDDEDEEQETANVLEIEEKEFDLSDNEDEFDTVRPLHEIYEEKKSKIEQKLTKLPDLTMEAVYLDRLMSMEYMQDLQADMRGFPNLNAAGDLTGDKKEKPHFFNLLEDKHGDSAQLDFGPSIKRYWALKSFVTKGREVTDIALHPTNGNMIAVSYGSFRFGDDEEGMVCLWSAKNTLHPERIYELKSAVTCLSFAKLTPYLLAIGLLDGNLLIYDVRNLSPVAVSSTLGSVDKHEGPVWQLLWFQETEMATTGSVNEILLSIGDDGRVNRWTSSKGFDSVTMLRVRKSPLRIPGRREKRADALTSNLSVPFSVCFYPNDWTLYLVGTEEGFIHKCSTSFTEQFLATYIGHSGPVYRIVFNAFDKTIFASASADWSVKVWREGTYTPLLSMQTGLRTVFDVTCCPTMSAVFVLASEFHVEVWDLTLNTLEPVVQFAPPYAVSFRRAVYSSYLDAVILGDDEGAITFYGLRDFPTQPVTDQEQKEQLLEGLIPGYKKSASSESETAAGTLKYFEDEVNDMHASGQAETSTSGVPKSEEGSFNDQAAAKLTITSTNIKASDGSTEMPQNPAATAPVPEAT